MKRLNHPLLARLIVVSTLLLGGCDSGGDSVTGSASGAAGDVVSQQAHTILDTNPAGVAELMRYRLLGVDEQVQESQAVVLIPSGSAPVGGWPVLVWGHGTTGVGDNCAPSLNSNLSAYLPYLSNLVNAGFAVVAPDYEGMGNTGSDHPYLHLESAGRSMLYAVKAAVAAYPELATRFAAIGHSQGGHAALGAAELAHEVSPLNFLGAVAIAPASHLEESAALLQSIAEDGNADAQDRTTAGIGWLVYASYLLYGLEVTDPSFDASTVYGIQGGDLAAAVESTCAPALFAGLQTAVPLLLQTVGDLDAVLPADIISDAKVQSYLAATRLGLGTIDAPVMILQGDEDTTVYPTFSQQLRDTLVAADVAVDYREFAATHGSVVEASATDALVWLTQLFAAP